MLFVTVRSSSAAEVPKVLQVVEQAKRLRHKAGTCELGLHYGIFVKPPHSGLDEDEALHQYVIYDTPKTKGPRRINLDDPSTGASKPYAPPTNLTVHLSKIDMPELPPLIERLRSLHPGEETQTHILHLASDGVILVSMLSGPTAHMVANAHLPAAR